MQLIFNTKKPKKPVSIFALHDSEWEYMYIVPMLKIFN